MPLCGYYCCGRTPGDVARNQTPDPGVCFCNKSSRGLITAAWTVCCSHSNLRQLTPNTAKLNQMSQTVIKNKTVATLHVESAPLTWTEHHELHSVRVNCTVTVLFFVTLVQTATWWSQHSVRKIHGFHSCCHGDHTVTVLTVSLQQAALCQSFSCQWQTNVSIQSEHERESDT